MKKLRVIIAEKDETFRRSLTEMLTKAGYLVIGEAGDGLTALKKVRRLQPEIVLTAADLPVSSGVELAHIIDEFRLAAIVLMIDYGGKELFKENSWVGPVLVKPFDEFHMLSVLEYSFAAFNKLLGLEKEVHRLKTDLETRKLVEKAKGILMEAQGLNEEAAFKRIQQQSMKKRTTMRKVAEAIILAYEIEK